MNQASRRFEAAVGQRHADVNLVRVLQPSNACKTMFPARATGKRPPRCVIN